MAEHETKPTHEPAADSHAHAAPHHHQTPRENKLAANTRLVKQQADIASAQSDRDRTVYAVAAVLDGNVRIALGAGGSHHLAITNLNVARTGRHLGQPVNGRTRATLFDEAIAEIAPLIESFRSDGLDEYRSAWLENVEARIATTRYQVQSALNVDRVDSAVLLDGGKAYDAALGNDPIGEQAAMRSTAERASSAVLGLAEMARHIDHASVAAAVALGSSSHHNQHGLASLDAIVGALQLVQGILSFSPEEFSKHLEEAKFFGEKIETMAEAVAASAELIGGAVATAAAIGSQLFKLTGHAHLAGQLASIAGRAVKSVSIIVAVVDGIASAVKLFDPRTSQADRIVAAMDVVSSAAVVLGEAGVVAATPVAIAVEVGASAFKLVVEQMGETSLGLTEGLMTGPLAIIQSDGMTIHAYMDATQKALALLSMPQTGEQRAGMERAMHYQAHQLTGAIHSLVLHMTSPGFEAGMAKSPGANAILRAAMSSIMSLRPKSPAAALHAAEQVMERVTWVLGHATELIRGAALGESFAEIEEGIEHASDDE